MSRRPRTIHGLRRHFLKGAVATGVLSLIPPHLSFSQGTDMKVEGPFRTRDELRASLAVTGVNALDQQMLIGLAKPGIALQSKSAPDKDIPIGASKIGGAPDLPPGLKWPTREPTAHGKSNIEMLRKLDAEKSSEYYKREIALKGPLADNPAPLTFMIQVDLADAAAAGEIDADIPREGWLLVFYDLVFRPWFGHDENDTPLFHVLHITGDRSALERRTPPDMGYPLYDPLDEYRNMLPPARLSPVFSYTLPDSGTLRIFARHAAEGRYPHEEWLDQSPTTHLNGANRLGGWPENIQGDMAIELAAHDAGIELPFGSRFIAAAQALQPRADQWVHLLQIGDYDSDVNDFDGLYHIWIKREDLKARDFTKARLIYRTS